MVLRPCSSRSRRRTAGLGVALIFGALAVAYSSTELGSVSASAAEVGALAVTPPSGDTTTTSTVAFTAPTACPAAATNAIVSIAGAGFPAGSIAVGNSELPMPGSAYTVPLGLTWNLLANSQGATLPLTGRATVTMKCTDFSSSADLGSFSADVTLTPATTAGADNSAYAVEGATASPSPSASPTSSPTGSPTPSASSSPLPSAPPDQIRDDPASPSPTASPDPAITPQPPQTLCVTLPSPSPSASATPPTTTESPSPTVGPSPVPTVRPPATTCASTSPGPGSGTGGDGATGGDDDGDGLPATGSNATPLLLLAATLLAGGTFLVLVSSRPVEITGRA